MKFMWKWISIVCLINKNDDAAMFAIYDKEKISLEKK